MAKFKPGHSLWFFFHTDVKMWKRPWNLYKYKKFPFKNFSWSFSTEVRQKPRCLDWLKTSQVLRLEENKVEFLERQFHNKKLSFVHKRETEHSFELSLSIYVFHRTISILKCKTLVLKTTNVMIARQPFCWWMSFTEVSNPFLPPPPKGLAIWLSQLGTGDLVWEEFFSQTSGVNFFSISRHEWYFFQCWMLFFPGISLRAFFPSKSVRRIFFLKSPITPSKVKWSATKIHQTFAQ